MIINIILFIILFLLIILVLKYKKNLTVINNNVIEENQKNEKHLKDLKRSIHFEEEALLELQKRSEQAYKHNQNIQFELQKMQDSAKENAQKTYQEAVTNYTDALEAEYLKAELNFDNNVKKLSEDYSKVELEHQEKISKIKAELDKIKETRKAAIAAQVREEEIKNKLEFYCLTPKTIDIADIQTLELIKPKLHNPRILSMLIWSTYFQKDMTTLCNRILGLQTITGIYKITNQENNKCYIGQSVDVAKRWKDHAKCGLGIDAPAGNKLYKEMQEIGIWNFSWELLEACPREQLNEKEKYYIELYGSKDFGYNTVKGNG